MLRRALRIFMWASLALTLLFGAAFAINFRTGLRYSAPRVEIALNNFHLIVMTRDPADLAMQGAKYGWSAPLGVYINNPGIQHWKTVSPWGTGTAVPTWMPLSASAFITLLLFAVTFKRRPRPGHCPDCGYDLRATPAGSACPECGKGAAAAS